MSWWLLDAFWHYVGRLSYSKALPQRSGQVRHTLALDYLPLIYQWFKEQDTPSERNSNKSIGAVANGKPKLGTSAAFYLPRPIASQSLGIFGNVSPHVSVRRCRVVHIISFNLTCVFDLIPWSWTTVYSTYICCCFCNEFCDHMGRVTGRFPDLSFFNISQVVLSSMWSRTTYFAHRSNF